jgi:hypothetical protein
LRSGGAILISQGFHVPPIAEKRAGHAKEPDIEWPYPEIEQVAPYQGSAADAVFPLKA